MRQIVLDTETTGLEVALDHRIIEIGGVEIIDRRLTGRHYHQYLQPDRAIDAGALEVHGISSEFLADKPRFADIVDEFLEFIEDAELIIHNAAFDVAFIDHELRLCKANTRTDLSCAKVVDSLAVARKKYPGQRNSLDALCRRLSVDNTRRKLHGALLDAEILADVYLLMTGGQSALLLESAVDQEAENDSTQAVTDTVVHDDLPIVTATLTEIEAHGQWLARLAEKGEGGCVWNNLQLDQK
jgi:DNA polymerase-3 subunit epsilon